MEPKCRKQKSKKLGRQASFEMDTKNNIKKSLESTQIRLPSELFEYIRQESDRIGISQNSYMLILMEDGRRLRNAQISLHDQKQHCLNNQH